MTEEREVKLCPLRMQECLRGVEVCLVGPVSMGGDIEEIASSALDCVYAGVCLPPYYYRGLKVHERKRYRRELVPMTLGG